MDILPSRVVMPCPFAGGDGASYTEPDSASSEATMNWQKGFGANYGVPASNGGKYVTRAEMNGLGRVATQDMFYHKCGGLNTFDSEFAEAIGGYPTCAVLDFVSGTNLFKVMSVKNKNKVDFTKVGVDGVNWIILNQDVADPLKSKTIGSFTHTSSSAISSQFIDTVVAPRAGIILAKNVMCETLGSHVSGYFALPPASAGVNVSGHVVENSYVAAKIIGNISDTESVTIGEYPQVFNLPTAALDMKGWTCVAHPRGFSKDSIYSAFYTYGGGAVTTGGSMTSGTDIEINTIKVEEGDIIAVCYVSGTTGINRVIGGAVTSPASVNVSFNSEINKVGFDLSYLI